MKKAVLLILAAILLMMPAVSGFAAGSASETEVKTMVRDYFNGRYQMLAGLEYDKKFEQFLAPRALAAKDAMNEADVLETIIRYRKAQVNDLRYLKHKFDLVFENARIEPGKAWITVDENYELYYRCAPTVRNKGMVEHLIFLEKLDGKWRLVKDDYTDPDGIKKALLQYFLSNSVSKEAAKKAIVEQSGSLPAARMEKLKSILEKETAEGIAAFYAGKIIAYAGGYAGRISPKGNLAPILADGHVLLPVKFAGEKLGAEVTWDAATSTVRIKNSIHSASFHPGGSTMTLDGMEVTLDTPVQFMNNSNLLDAAALARILDKKLYIDSGGLVILSDNTITKESHKPLIDALTAYFGVLFTKADFPRIDGSTATYPLSIEMGKELLGLDETGAKGFITHKTTHNAYVHLIHGDADIILVTPPSPEELALAKEKGVELEVIPVCKEGFVFLVNRENPVNNLTVKQVQDIYQGKITNWKEVGGEDSPIIAYQREPNSGSQTLMEATVMKGLKMAAAPKEVLVYGMGELIDRVADYSNAKNALGYSVYYYATKMYGNRAIKLLSINGTAPGKQTIKDDSYPFTVGYYAVLRKDEPADSSARRLLRWLLGEEGQALVDRAGFVPVK